MMHHGRMSHVLLRKSCRTPPEALTRARAVEDANAQISLCHLKHTTCNPSVLKVKRQQHHDSHPISATPRSPGMCQCETGGQYDIRVNYGIAAMRAYGRGHVVCAVALPPS